MLSTIQTMGYVTKDLELRKGKNNVQYIRVSLAVHKGYGEKKRTLFLQTTFFQEQAERLIHAKVKKGSLLEITGDVDDILVFTLDNGELATVLKITPYNWTYVPSKKMAASSESVVEEKKPEPITPEEAVCDDQDLPF